MKPGRRIGKSSKVLDEDQQQPEGKRRRGAAADPKPIKQKSEASKVSNHQACKTDGQQAGSTYFLLKSEPDELGADHLEAAPNGIARYDGVRGGQACKFMKTMKTGDKVFFYHSSCKIPGIYAMAEVVAEPYPDFHSWTPGHKYFDPKSTQEKPRWVMVDLKFLRKVEPPLTLVKLKEHSTGGLAGMRLFNQPRLSVQPISDAHAKCIFEIEGGAQNKA